MAEQDQSGDINISSDGDETSIGNVVSGGVGGDAVAGDKVGGDKVAGGKIEAGVYIERAEIVIGSKEAPSHINTAEAPPDNFIPRPDEFNQIIEPLLNPSDTHTLALTTALQGGGGFGKTTLAQAICCDERIRNNYTNILWLTIGQSPMLLELLNNLIKLFDPDAPEFANINTASARFRDLLKTKSTLIVLDDVWQETDALPFIQRNSSCTYLITTRRQDIVSRLDADPIDVNQMTTDQAAKLLVSGLTEPPDDMRSLHALAAHLGEWPLLVNLAAAQLKELIHIDRLPLDEALAELWEALEEEGFTAFDRTDEAQRNRAVSISLNLSLERLGRWREQYLDLAVFPGNVDIPFATIGRLWSQLNRREVKTAIRTMQRLSLFNHYNPERKTLRLHDVVRHYLLEQQSDLPSLHNRLLKAHRPTQQGWHILDPNDPYLWDHLVDHLIRAELRDELYQTVTDLRYLSAKCQARTAAGAEADLRAALSQFPDGGALGSLTRHLTTAVHLLSRCEQLNDIQQTLYSRLSHLDDLQTMAEPLKHALDPPYLIPRHRLPDLPHPALIRTLEGHADIVYGCAFSADGKLIVSASSDDTLKLWQAETGQLIRTLEGHADIVYGCAFSADGKLIVSVSWDKTLKLWEADIGQLLHTLEGHTDWVTGCAFSADGRLIVSASYDQTLKLWEADTGQPLRTLKGHTDWVTGCAFSVDGKLIVSASLDKTLKLWNAETGQLIRTLEGHTDSVYSCAISADSKLIVSASDDKTLKLWNAETGQLIRTLEGHTDSVYGCAISADGRLIVSASSDDTLKLWEADIGQLLHTLEGHTDWVTSCALSADGRLIVSASYDQTLKLWEADTGQLLRTLKGHTSYVTGCAISADSKLIVSASDDKTIRLWGADTGQLLRTLKGHTDSVNGCAISADSKLIVSASDDQTLKLWETDTGQLLRTLKGHIGWVNSCALSVDGRLIASASQDKTLKLWNAETGQLIRTLEGHTSFVTSCALSGDGRLIVSASDDKTLKLWQAERGRCLLTIAVEGTLRDCCFSSDEASLIAVGDGGVYSFKLVL